MQLASPSDFTAQKLNSKVLFSSQERVKFILQKLLCFWAWCESTRAFVISFGAWIGQRKSFSYSRRNSFSQLNTFRGLLRPLATKIWPKPTNQCSTLNLFLNSPTLFNDSPTEEEFFLSFKFCMLLFYLKVFLLLSNERIISQTYMRARRHHHKGTQLYIQIRRSRTCEMKFGGYTFKNNLMCGS